MNYLRIYNALVHKRIVIAPLKHSPGIERHHIIHKACGGSNEQSNLVNLTAREHFIAHHLLVKIYADTEYSGAMALAMKFLCDNHSDNKCTAKVYQYIRESTAKHMSELRKGKPLSEKNCLGISKALTGRKRTEAECKAISKGKKGKPLSEKNKC